MINDIRYIKLIGSIKKYTSTFQNHRKMVIYTVMNKIMIFLK